MKKFVFLLICVIAFSLAYSQDPTHKAADDDYWTSPKKPYNERRLMYLNYCAANASTDPRDGVFSQVARLELDLPVNEDFVRQTIAVVNEAKDCNDFAAGGLLRLYYLNKSKNKLSPKLVQEIDAALTGFKYWWDEPEKDTQYRCYHTENHQGLYHEDELLAGQLFKDKLFKNGKIGKEHIQHATLLINRWLGYREKFGFSEWLSNNYIDVDLLTLANLYDFAEDASIRSRAGVIIDMLMYDMALNNFHGVFGSTHGRTYNKSVTGGRNEATSPTMKLMFGVGVFNSPEAKGTVSLATSRYRCPSVIQHIAVNYSKVIDDKERQSIEVEDAPKYGLSYNNELDCGMFWGMQEFIHPDVIAMSEQISQKYDVWPYRDYDYYKKQYAEQVKQYGKIVNPYLDRYALSEANTETYRTPYYMLSSVQDYRHGNKGYQQHIWQATLGTDAVVFTNHPGENTATPTGKETSPAYWAGNKILPRTVQYKNVVICIYNIPANDPLPFSHAYFPKDAFDEVIEKDNWTFGRKDKTYIALYSQNKTTWMASDKGSKNELRAATPQNIWICEMGSEQQWKSFSSFVKKVTSAKITSDSLNVSYASPSIGETKFGWSGQFVVNNKPVSIDNYLRFDNPWSTTSFAAKSIIIKSKDQKLVLNLKN
jgi:hypothetical protein